MSTLFLFFFYFFFTRNLPCQNPPDLIPAKGGFATMQWNGLVGEIRTRVVVVAVRYISSLPPPENPGTSSPELLLFTWATGSEGQCDGARMERHSSQCDPSTRQNQKESHPEPGPGPSTVPPCILKPGSTANASGSVLFFLQLVAGLFNSPPGQQVLQLHW